MISARSEQFEQDRWATLNQLEESVSLSSKIAGEARTRGYDRAAASFEEKAERSRRRAELICRALQDDETTETVEID